MITCQRCQHQNKDTANRCDLCGAQLSGGAAQPARQSSLPASRPTPGATSQPAASAPAQDVEWNVNDAPDLFGLAGESDPARRAGGSALKVPAPRVAPPRPASGGPVRRSTEPSGLAKLLQDALNTNSGKAEAPSAPAVRRMTLDVPAARTSNPGSGPVPVATAQPMAAVNVGQDDLSDFLLDALSQEQEPASRPRPAAAAAAAVSATARSTASRAGGPRSQSNVRPQPGASQPGSRSVPGQPDPRIPAAQLKGAALTCGSCGGPNPEGMDICVHCGNPLHMLGLQAQSETECAACGTLNPLDNRFCGSCGYPLASGGEAPNWQDAIASSSGSTARHGAPWSVALVSINEDGSDGVAIPLDFRKTVVGRSGDTRFPTDAFLSPKHAAISIDDAGVYIEDLYSLNGTFVKLRDEVTLTPGDIFLMGRQVLRFERFEQTITPKARSSDGTRYMGSPPPGGKYKLLQIGIGGVVQNVYCIPDNGAVLGREQGEIIFPRDKFMSSRHAQLFPREEGKFCLVDLNSSNGTWIKIWEKTQIHDEDYVFLGQQLFRVEMSTRG